MQRNKRARLALTATWVAACGLGGCAASTTATAEVAPGAAVDGESSDPLVAAERALTMGNPVRAVRLVEKIGPLDPQFEKASDILERARFEVEAITVDWLDQIDALVQKGEIKIARERATYMAAEFPLTDDLRTEVDNRLKQIKAAYGRGEQRLAELDRQAGDQLTHHDLEAAAATLREAERAASGLDPARGLARERALLAVELRLEQQKTGGSGETPVDRSTLKIRRQSLRKKKPVDKPAPAPAIDKPAAVVAPVLDPANEQKIQELLRDGTRFQKEKDYYQAIMAYEKVRRLDSKNEAAKVALSSLESKRLALVADNLAKANAHFLKQDLARAVPFFKKVRDLDPNNQEAREGLEMYENLERIRGNQTATPR
jgi:tetratricopeptide (TPR) repeat protein